MKAFNIKLNLKETAEGSGRAFGDGGLLIRGMAPGDLAVAAAAHLATRGDHL